MRALIVGYGEVGKAIHQVIGKAEIVDLKLGTQATEKFYDVTHICIPYSTGFIQTVRKYKKISGLVIVHSSVPVNTCDKLKVVHSPIRGVHPHLAKGIRTFVKYFGGKKAQKAARIFKNLGIKSKMYRDARTTEALKLWDTTQYGRLIKLEKEIHAWCKKFKIDFNVVYTQANKDYNEGYTKLKRPEVVRPYLKHMKGPIGGHCVMPNLKLLKVKL